MRRDEPGDLTYAGLLRRLAVMSPERALSLTIDVAPASQPEIAECLRAFGPVVGVGRLSRSFSVPRANPTSRPSRNAYGDATREFIRDLHRQVPRWRPGAAASVLVPRVDAQILGAVSDVRDLSVRSEVLESLYREWAVPPELDRLAHLGDTLRDRVDLTNTVLIAHQHLMASVATQIRALWTLGLKPQNTYLFGKPYSTAPIAATYLEGAGCVVRTGLEAFSRQNLVAPDWYHTEHDDVLGRGVQTILEQVCSDPAVSRVAVLDDGGLVLSAVQRAIGQLSPQARPGLRRLAVAAVEQTTFGRRMVGRLPSSSQDQTSIPVANVAQTRLKIEYESEYIARSVLAELRAWLVASDRRDHARALSDASVGVIGYGAVGAWVASQLRARTSNRLLIYDHDVSRSSIARSAGFSIAHSPSDLLQHCDVIIGCSGDASGVDISESDVRAGTVFASASSGNYEFARLFSRGAPEHRRLNPAIGGRRAAAFDWVHSIVSVDLPRGESYLLNGGFPVNFTGAADPIRPDEIELTRCLMVQGLACALEQASRGNAVTGHFRVIDVDEAPLVELLAP